jgi:hypothetical protein
VIHPFLLVTAIDKFCIFDWVYCCRYFIWVIFLVELDSFSFSLLLCKFENARVEQELSSILIYTFSTNSAAMIIQLDS